MRMFLLRPFLLVLYRFDQTSNANARNDDSVESMVERDTLARISNTCVSATRELVDLMSEAVEHGNDSSFAWWYDVFCVYPSFKSLNLGALTNPQIYILRPQ